MFRAGFVSILGRPNAGKSTLLNTLLGEKLAIIAKKPQTTRTTIQGVLTTGDAQIVFIDTPGIHKSGALFNRRMMDTVRSAVEDRDVLLFVADALQQPGAEDARAVSILKSAQAAGRGSQRRDNSADLAAAGESVAREFRDRTGTPAFLALNKVDRLRNKATVLERIEQYKALHDFAEYFPVSALTGDGLGELKKAIVERLPESEAFFPPGYITDQPERFLIAELIREKILELTHQEVPHAVAVLIERWEETPKLVRIYATIYVERDGQKAIIIGAGGTMLKQVGTAARIEAEHLLGRKIYLELFVKVRPSWREDPQFLNEIDWRSTAGL